MRKYPIYIQDDEISCGVYCIKMILKYYDIEEDTVTLKKRARVDHTGTTIKGLVETFKSYSIEAKAYHASLEDIQSHITLPCILHLVEEGKGHFVVLYEIKGETYVIGDPANGIVFFDHEELASLYSENVVSVTHIGRYFNYENKTFQQFLKEIKKMYHKEIYKLGSSTFFITIFSYVLALIYASLIDFMKIETPMNLLIVISAAYLLVGIIKTNIEKSKEKKSILLTRAFDKEFVYRSICDAINQQQETGSLHPKIMDLYQLSHFCVAYFSIFYVDLISILIELGGLLIISRFLSLILTILLLFLAVFIYFKSKRFMDLYKDYIAAHVASSQALIEYLDMREMGKRYYGKHQWIKRYEHYYENEANHKQDQEEFSLSLSTGMRLIHILGEALILFIGLLLYHLKKIHIGEVFLFYMVYNMMISPLIHLCTTLVEYSQSTLLYEKYKELTEEKVQGEILLEEPVHAIHMNNVSYAYGFHEPVINHLDLEIDHSFFLFGDNGSGKSTLGYLLEGNDACYRGEILINHIPLKDINQDSLKKHIIRVQEHEPFMPGSLKEVLNCEDEKLFLPLLFSLTGEKLISLGDSPITSSGCPLSLGEQQILSLARALLCDGDVYILDEALSHLSYERKETIIHYLFEEYQDKLFVIISHDKKIMNIGYDYVIMEKGKIIEKG